MRDMTISEEQMLQSVREVFKAKHEKFLCGARLIKFTSTTPSPKAGSKPNAGKLFLMKKSWRTYGTRAI